MPEVYTQGKEIMTVFVIAVGIYAVLELGGALQQAVEGRPETRTRSNFVIASILWAILAGGALGALLV